MRISLVFGLKNGPHSSIYLQIAARYAARTTSRRVPCLVFGSVSGVQLTSAR